MRKQLKFINSDSDIRTRLAEVAVEDLVESLMELSIRHNDADAIITRLMVGAVTAMGGGSRSMVRAVRLMVGVKILMVSRSRLMVGVP